MQYLLVEQLLRKRVVGIDKKRLSSFEKDLPHPLTPQNTYCTVLQLYSSS